MGQTPATRQKAYRKRKKRTKFFARSYWHQRVTELSAQADKQREILALIDELYDLTGPRVTERMGILLCESLAVVTILQAG